MHPHNSLRSACRLLGHFSVERRLLSFSSDAVRDDDAHDMGHRYGVSESHVVHASDGIQGAWHGCAAGIFISV